MKKTITLSVILALFCTFSFAQKEFEAKFSQPSDTEYQVAFSLKDWSIQHVQFDGKDFQQIVFNNSTVTKEKGWAELPFITASIQLPAQKDVDLSVILTEYTDYQLDFPLVPSRGGISRNQDTSTIPYEIDAASIVDKFYPDNLAVAEEPYIIRDVRGTTVTVYPFQWNAVTQTLRVYTKATVTLTENNQPATNPLLRENPNPIREVRGMYKTIFMNYQESRIPLVMAEYGDILVITTARDEDAIQPYIDWKKEKGYNVDKEVVAAGYSATQTKALIQSKYNNNPNLMYVLLVGDWNEIKSDVLSCWLGSGPTDPILGDVAGNTSDYRPDISIGRMSANSDAQVTIQVNKAIQYEKNPNMDAGWYSSFIGIGSNDNLAGLDDNERDWLHIQRIYSERLEPTYNYDTHYRLYENESGCTSTNLANYINNGASTIAYSGHGGVTNWLTTNFTNSHVNNLTNGTKLPFIISVACLVGAFHNSSDCFAETWLRKENGGAVVTWMSTIQQPIGEPMRGQDYFYDILIGGFDYTQYSGQSGINTNELRTHWGSIAINAANLMLSESPGTDDKYTVRTWTTFGDPSLQLRTKLPAQIASSATVINIGTYETTITADGVPVKDALVCISQDGVYHSAFTNEDGVVSIENDFVAGEALLVVTGFNTTTIYETIECITSPDPQLCEKPVELAGSVHGYDATITWNQPVNIDGTLLGYHIYRNETLINEALLIETEYIDENLAVGTYTYKVAAVYEQCAESELTEGVTIEIVYIPVLCEMPLGLTGTPDRYAAALTWEQPEKIDGTLSGYNIYRDETQINEELLMETTFIDEGLAEGMYIYQVSAVYEHCPESELTEGVTVIIKPDAIHEANAASFDIYPNPTTGQLTINNEQLTINSIEIFEIYGRKLSFNHLITPSSNHLINISNLPAGVYFLKISTEVGEVVKKVVKM